MNDDELNPRDGEDTNGGEDTGNRPNLGTAPSGPKHPGNGGGKDQYSIGGDEESTENSPVEEGTEEEDE